MSDVFVFKDKTKSYSLMNVAKSDNFDRFIFAKMEHILRNTE